MSWVEASRFDAGHRLRRLRPPHLRRHRCRGSTAPTTTAGAGRASSAPTRACAATPTSSREDRVQKSLLFLGTEFGLWISLDGGGHWAEFKGGNFPSVAVRDLAIQARDNDLVIAHPRPRHLDRRRPDAAARAERRDAGAGGGLPARAAGPAADPGQRRLGRRRRQVRRARTRQDGAVITYYQRTRHLFGPIKLEVLDAEGKVVDTLPAEQAPRHQPRRVDDAVKPPRVPRAAQVAFTATQRPARAAGHLHRAPDQGRARSSRASSTIGLDRRATYSAADRKRPVRRR